MVTFCLVAGFAGLAAFFGYWYGLVHGHRYRYLNPQLHEGGPWQMETGTGAVVWRQQIAPKVVPDISPGHTHRIALCTLTASMAHVDQCWCGATRYGVFGPWQEATAGV
jgi:hypothetical protein